MKKAFAPTLILAGLFVAGTAAANPYASWQSTVSDDDTVRVEDSFNRKSSSTITEDNDVSLSLSKSKTISEDNDYTSSYSHSEDNDSYASSSYWKSEDNDRTSIYKKSEDNDYTSTYTHTEDNDVTEDNDTSTVIDFQIATPTLTSHKYQDQHAGHQAETTAFGQARGHEVGVQGGTTVVSAGNDEQVFYGPAMVNNNTNQLPQNNLFVQGSNGAPISQSNTFAGRDMGPKGVFAPIGNTSAAVMGDVGQSSGAQVGQYGDSGNSIADQMDGSVRK